MCSRPRSLRDESALCELFTGYSTGNSVHAFDSMFDEGYSEWGSACVACASTSPGYIILFGILSWGALIVV